jgi:hypothetical protein
MWAFSSGDLYSFEVFAMFDLTNFLFARFHINGLREEKWNLVHKPF